MKTFGLFAVALLIGSTCQANPILGNLPGSGTYTGDNASLSATTWVAAGVLIGGTEEQFTQLEGYFVDAFSEGSATIAGWIYSDSSGQPGSIVGTFGGQTVSAGGTPTELTLTTTATVDLQAATKYWFVVEDAVGVAWRSDSSNTNTPTAENGSGVSFLGYQNTFNSGSTWSTLGVGNPTIEIDAISISSSPEPATVLLLLSGAAFLILRRRHSVR